MATTLTFTQHAYFTDSSGNVTRVNGSLSEPLVYTLTGDTYIRNTFTVADAATQVLLSCGSGSTNDIASFSALLIESTQDLKIEFQGGAVAANNSNVKAKANWPLWLFSDFTLTYNASGGFAGSDSAIQTVTGKNSSGSSARVTITAFK